MKKVINNVCLFMVVFCFVINPIRIKANERVLPSQIKEDEIADVIDEYVDEHIETTAGMAYSVFSVSQDIATGYYGYANKETGTIVDENTVFEWGSASKLMVWVSVMQLKELGQIDLEEDIQIYLPEGFLHNLKYDTKITMIDLMNHSAGFQEDDTDIFVKEIGGYTSLESALLAHEPAQIFEPGTIVAYSNWSTALAAYIVERVSGMEYADYVHQHIFEPLQMQHSAIAMDLSDNEWVAEKRKELACYDTEGNLMPDAFFYITLYPAGSCTSTLDDFRTFARSLMDENTVLFQDSDTWKEMFTATRMYGETDVARNYHGMWMVPLGVQTIGHGGNTYGCSSYLLMNLESGIGTVVMTNQAQESVYNIDMMELIYGKYTDSSYAIDKGIPQGIFKTARTFLIGPLKILNFGYSGDLDEDDVFYVYSEQGQLRRVEYPYTDYYGISNAEMIFEIAIVLAFLISFLLTIGIFLFRGIRCLVRRLKKRVAVKGNSFINLIFVTELTILGLIIYAATRLTAYALAVHYQWSIVLIALLGIVLMALTIISIVKNLRIKTGKLNKAGKWNKVANYIVIASGFCMTINLIYWNMFMFWAL